MFLALWRRRKTTAGIDIWVAVVRLKASWRRRQSACIGGQFQGRLLFRNNDERERASRCGITDFDRKYEILDLASGNVMFAATGVTDGTMLRGVRFSATGATTQSMVMRSLSGTVRVIEAIHNFDRKRPEYLEDE